MDEVHIIKFRWKSLYLTTLDDTHHYIDHPLPEALEMVLE